MNDMEKYQSSYEDLPESLRKFINNVPRAGYDNIYHVRSVDMDGNIIDEKFGMNVMTNVGLTKMFVKDYYSTEYIWGGLNNDVEPQPSDTSLTEKSPFPKSMTNGTISYNYYGLKYHPGSHMLTSLCLRYNDFYYDYNYSGITEDVEIKELGYGPSSTDLSMHALIYDKDGNKSSIIKKPNTRLYVSVYIQAGINVDLFDQLWRKGIYFFNTPGFWHQVTGRSIDGAWRLNCEMVYMTRNAKGPYRANHEYMDRTDYYPCDKRINTEDKTIYQVEFDQDGTSVREWKYDYISAILFGDIYTDTENINEENFVNLPFWGFKLIQMNELEDIVIERAYTNSSLSRNFSSIFGATTDFNHASDMTNYSTRVSSAGMLSMTQFSIQDVSLYNHQTKQWDIAEEFVSDPDYLYDEINSIYMGYAYMKDPSGVNRGCAVFINYKADKYKIKSFSNSNMSMYASDTWWDVSTWSPVFADLNNIPKEYRQKRYYILTQWSKANQLRPVYYKEDEKGNEISIFHGLKLPEEKLSHTITKIPSDSRLYAKYNINQSYVASSNKNNWFIINDYIIYPENPNGVKCYKMNNYNNISNNYYFSSESTMFSTDDRVVTSMARYRDNNYNYYTGIRIYVLDNEGSVAPKYVDIPLTISGNSGYYDRTDSGYSSSGYWHARFSTSSNGWVMYNSSYYWHPIIIDIYGVSNADPIESLSDVDFDRKPKYYQLTGKQYRYAHIQNLTDFLVYYNPDAETVNTIEIMDLKTREVVKTFTLPTDRQYSIVGIRGWDDIVYVIATSSGAYYIFMYNMSDEQVINLGMSSFSIFNHGDLPSSYIPEMSNEYVYCLGSDDNDDWDDYRSMFVTKQDPTNFKYFTNHKDLHYRNVFAGQLHFTDEDHTHMVLSANCPRHCGQWHAGDHYIIYDMWDLVDNGPNLIMPCNNFMYYGDSTDKCETISIVLYKDRVMRIVGQGYSNFGEIISYPIQYSLPHKIHGTTKTLSAWNNPFQITKGLHWKSRVTNDVNKIKAISSGDPTPASDGDNNG